MRGLLHRVSFILILLGLFSFASATPALADAKSKKEIETKMKEAMENYDLLEYEEARKILNQALTVAKKAKMENDPVTAKVHLRLGIVYFAGLQDAESAKLSFLNAAEIDKGIALDKAYATAEMAKLLDEAKAEAGGSGGGGGGDIEPAGGGGADVDCSTVAGVQHTIIDTAKGGKDLVLDAAVGADVQPAKVAIMYRARGATDFTESKMIASGCVYRGVIPKAALSGDLIHYYVAAYNDQGRVIASKGSAGSPNIVEIAGGVGGGVIRDTIKLDGAPEDMDVDVVAIGPLFVSGGAGYSAALGGSLALIAELNAVAGIPIVKELGASRLNFGVQLDFNLGLHIGF